MNKKLQFVLPIIVLVVSSFIAWQIIENPTKARKKSQLPETRLRVSVSAMQAQTFQPVIKSYGEVKAKISGSLVAEVAGKLVFVSPKLRAGGQFQKGEKLAQIDPRHYETELIVAEGNLATANFKLEEEIALGQQADANWKKIGQSNIATSLALRKPHLIAAKAQVRSAEALLMQAKLNLEKTAVIAPYAGKVRNKYVDEGQYLGTNTVLADIFGSESLDVRLPVSLSQIEFLDLPGSASSESTNKQSHIVLEASHGVGEQQWGAKISAVEHVVDPQSKQLHLIADIKSNPLIDSFTTLKLGQFVKASIKGRPIKNVFIIPRSALYQNDTVYLAEADRLVKRKVSLIWSDEKNAVVKEGLETGDILITTPLGNPVSGTLLSTEHTDISANQNAAS